MAGHTNDFRLTPFKGDTPRNTQKHHKENTLQLKTKNLDFQSCDIIYAFIRTTLLTMGVGEGTAVTEEEVLSHTVKVNRMQKVYDLMREGEWKEVCKEFQGEDEYRETLLLWVRPSQVDQIQILPKRRQILRSALNGLGQSCSI